MLLCLSRIFLFHKNWHPHAQTPSEGVREKKSNIPDPPGPWLPGGGVGGRVGSSDVKTWASPTARAGEHSVDGSHRPIKTLACGANAPLGHLTWYAAQGALRRRQVITGSHYRKFEEVATDRIQTSGSATCCGRRVLKFVHFLTLPGQSRVPRAWVPDLRCR